MTKVSDRLGYDLQCASQLCEARASLRADGRASLGLFELLKVGSVRECTVLQI